MPLEGKGIAKGHWQARELTWVRQCFVFLLMLRVQMRSQCFQHSGQLAGATNSCVSPHLRSYLPKIILTFFPLLFFKRLFIHKPPGKHLLENFNDLLNSKSLSEQDLHLQRLKHCDPLSSPELTRTSKGVVPTDKQGGCQTKHFKSKSFLGKVVASLLFQLSPGLELFCLNQGLEWAASPDSLVPARISPTAQTRAFRD